MSKLKKIVSLVLVGVMACSMVACSSKEETKPKEKDVKVSEIHQAVKEAYGDSYYPNMDYDAAALENIFGVKADWCEEFVAQGPMISTSVDTFVAIKAKADNVEDVKTALTTYQDNLKKDMMQYPTNLLKIQTSKVEVYGNYVFFILLGEIPMDVEEQGDDAILKAAEEQEQIAVDAIKGVLYE